MYIKRAIENKILEISSTFPIVLITGPRQVGKTTVFEQLRGADRGYVSLDDPTVRLLAKTDPVLFMQRYTPPIIIDEIQYAPELLPYLKIAVDKDKMMGSYWLTGSQMFHLMKSVSESLAGRVGIINLLALSGSEINNYQSTPFLPDKESFFQKLNVRRAETSGEIFEKIFKGAMPAIYAQNPDLDTFFGSYINLYLGRDIKDLTQVADEMVFLKFLTAVAARTGQMLNYAQLSKELGISGPTVKQWVSLLVTSGIVYLLEPYYNNALKRLIKTPKIYFLDTGIAAFLLKWSDGKVLETGAMAGAFFETYVVSEIIKGYYNAEKRPPLFYYRDKEQREIDLIIEQNGILYPIEIKKNGTPDKEAIKHFSVLANTKMPVGLGAVICNYTDLVPLDKDNWVVPVWLI